MKSNGDELSIQQLVELEKGLAGDPPSLDRDAKVNLLKYLQVRRVNEYQTEYDRLYFALNRGGELELLRNNIAAGRYKPLQQPKKAALLQEYLADAREAQRCLEELAEEVVSACDGGCESRYNGMKSPESIMRKADKFCGGNLGKIADIARVALVCETPRELERSYAIITACFHVRRSMTEDRRPQRSPFARNCCMRCRSLD